MEANDKSCPSPGYTLVEIMIAMVIALIVMGGVYRAILDENVNQDRSEKILDMQNNARVALDRVARDVRRAGFLGCGGSLAANTLTNAGTDATQIGQLTVATNPPGREWKANDSILARIIDQLDPDPVLNVDYLGEPLGFSDNAPGDHPHYQVGTDAITLVYLAEERSVDDTAPMAAGTDDITITAEGFAQDDIIYVTDCEDYSLFQKTNGDGTVTVQHAASTGLNSAAADLRKNYGQSALARVFKLATATYFIRKDNFELSHNAKGRAIANNIEDLQFEFLADENNNGQLNDDPWRTDLAAYGSAREVRAVRIWVLAMSEPDYSYTDTNTYVYPNSPYAVNSPAALAPIVSPSDGEHRHRFFASAVVYLRNAGL